MMRLTLTNISTRETKAGLKWCSNPRRCRIVFSAPKKSPLRAAVTITCTRIDAVAADRMEKSVLIVGGGIAGLSAAAELLGAGWRVTLVEAKPRLGGRIHTVSSDGVPVELGAEFVHGDNQPLAKAICDAGLSTHSVSTRNRILKDGRLKSVDLWERAGAVIKRIDPRSPDESFLDFLAHTKVRAEDRQIATSFVEGFNAADARRI